MSFFLIAFAFKFVFLLRFGVICLTPLFVPFVLVFAFTLLLPIEKLINFYYISKARKKLAEHDNLIKIAITGSYAKTTNKFILNTILSKKYKTLTSPKSYNTPLGLTKVILSELKSEHQVFIAEMGAKKKGEIDQLCKLIKPHHGILTSVGSQHLETFKSLENIKKTKNELCENITNGFMVYNCENQTCKELFEDSGYKSKVATYLDNTEGFCYCSNIKANENGTQFVLNIDGFKLECQTKLMGRFNLENISLCSALAFKLGVGLTQIKDAISELKPISHRMELIQGVNSIVIDDSFNASVEGCKAALEVLSLFENKTKVIVTPGIVEMGDIATKVNFDFGKQIADVCDYAIIVNEINAQAIKDGLFKNGFDHHKIFFAENLEKAKEKLVELALDDSVVLFENDLPDLYSY